MYVPFSSGESQGPEYCARRGLAYRYGEIMEWERDYNPERLARVAISGVIGRDYSSR